MKIHRGGCIASEDLAEIERRAHITRGGRRASEEIAEIERRQKIKGFEANRTKTMQSS